MGRSGKKTLQCRFLVLLQNDKIHACNCIPDSEGSNDIMQRSLYGRLSLFGFESRRDEYIRVS